MSATIARRPLGGGLRAAVATARIGALVGMRAILGTGALRIWILLCLALIAVLAIAGAQTIQPGAEVFGTGPLVEWGALIAGYLLFVLTTSGLCLIAALAHVVGLRPFRPIALRALVLAIPSLFGGFAIIALDLHDPIRLAFGVVLSPNPASPMWWMGVVYGGYLVVLLVELIGSLAGWARIARIACYIATVFAVAAPSTLGAVFWVLVARPYWNAGFVPLQLVISAVLSGSAALGIVTAVVVLARLRGARDLEAAGSVRAVVGLLAIVLIATILVTASQVLWRLLGPVDEPLRRSTLALAVGPLWPAFWGRIVLGLAIPLAILASRWGRRPEGLLAAGILVLTGLVGDRYSFVTGGQVAPATTAAGIAGEPWATYLPSGVEIGVVIGAFGLVALIFTFAERLLDLSIPINHGDRGDVE